MLELKEVSFTIRKDGEEVPLVDRVSISVPKGHFMAIVGPSGCGKTTLLKTIAGLNPESAGSLTDAAALAQLVPGIAGNDVFLCGANEWMDAARRAAIECGVPAANIHDERFSW